MKITTTLQSLVTPAAHMQHDLLRKRDVQTCGDLRNSYNSNIAAPSCAGPKSLCVFTNNMQGCYDNAGSSQFYTTCNPAGSPATCVGSDASCLSCTTPGTTNCVKYALFETSVGTFYGFGCGTSFVDPRTTIYGLALTNAAIAVTTSSQTTTTQPTTAMVASSSRSTATLSSSPSLTTSTRTSSDSSTASSSTLSSSSSSSSTITSSPLSTSSSIASTTRTETAADTTSTGSASPSSIATSSHSLSTGAKAGIGVGVAVGVIAIIALVLLVLHQRSGAKKAQSGYRPGPPPTQHPMAQQNVGD